MTTVSFYKFHSSSRTCLDWPVLVLLASGLLSASVRSEHETPDGSGGSRCSETRRSFSEVFLKKRVRISKINFSSQKPTKIKSSGSTPEQEHRFWGTGRLQGSAGHMETESEEEQNLDLYLHKSSTRSRTVQSTDCPWRTQKNRSRTLKFCSRTSWWNRRMFWFRCSSTAWKSCFLREEF